mmetsp:Transcript_85891/g.248028  ORF Transcript_85891/g.248028 Transcript_85891/m.248028 type:complete len:287 (-) Transcript_85891:303-1163(-)
MNAGGTRSPKIFFRLTSSSFLKTSVSALPRLSPAPAAAKSAKLAGGAVAICNPEGPDALRCPLSCSRAEKSSSNQESIELICSLRARRSGTTNGRLAFCSGAFSGSGFFSGSFGDGSATCMRWSRKNSFEMSPKFCWHCPGSTGAAAVPGPTAACSCGFCSADVPPSRSIQLSMSEAVKRSPARGTTATGSGAATGAGAAAGEVVETACASHADTGVVGASVTGVAAAARPSSSDNVGFSGVAAMSFPGLATSGNRSNKVGPAAAAKPSAKLPAADPAGEAPADPR